MTIIVPACARCNQRRGCRELVLFLLTRPKRISAFLDHLSSLTPEGLRQMDVRVFAEVCAAVWMLNESLARGAEWRAHLRRLCSGRTLHRRRYAARRVVGSVGRQVAGQRRPEEWDRGPSCLLPPPSRPEAGSALEEPLERMAARLLGLLALAWQASSEEIDRAIRRQRHRAPVPGSAAVQLDGRHRRPRRRTRVDQRRGRAAR